MEKIIILALIGFIAQLIDGSLGMAYGVTTTSLLFLYGLPVSIASASVHMAEVFTTAASGVAHVRFGNVDKKTVYQLLIPGSIGAFCGAIFISYIPGDMAKPYVSIFLLLLGLFVLVRFLFPLKFTVKKRETGRLLYPLGLLAGFADASGGGGWGPMTTPILISRNPRDARKVIGSVDTSEFAVALSATLGFLLSLGWEKISWTWVTALIIGGMIAAPLAAWLIRIMPLRLLGVLVGGVIILTNLNTIFSAFHVAGSIQWTIYMVTLILWSVSIAYCTFNYRKI